MPKFPFKVRWFSRAQLSAKSLFLGDCYKMTYKSETVGATIKSGPFLESWEPKLSGGSCTKLLSHLVLPQLLFKFRWFSHTDNSAKSKFLETVTTIMTFLAIAILISLLTIQKSILATIKTILSTFLMIMLTQKYDHRDDFSNYLNIKYDLFSNISSHLKDS